MPQDHILTTRPLALRNLAAWLALWTDYLVRVLSARPIFHTKRAGAKRARAMHRAAHAAGVSWMAAAKTYRGGHDAAVTSPFFQFGKAA